MIKMNLVLFKIQFFFLECTERILGHVQPLVLVHFLGFEVMEVGHFLESSGTKNSTNYWCYFICILGQMKNRSFPPWLSLNPWNSFLKSKRNWKTGTRGAFRTLTGFLKTKMKRTCPGWRWRRGRVRRRSISFHQANVDESSKNLSSFTTFICLTHKEEKRKIYK